MVKENSKTTEKKGYDSAKGKKKKQVRQPKPERKLRIIPLGGIGEIGKNMTVVEYGDDMIVIDCGVSFPESEMLGIDYVIPDAQYLHANKEKLKGFIFTHGHEDHIGATPFILPDFRKTPLYGGKLTLALIEYKMEEHGINDLYYEVVKNGSQIKLGCFTITFAMVTHSIADAFALIIDTPVGRIVHTGDFKIDHTPLDPRQRIDLPRFAQLGQDGVLLLMSDSTNADHPGYTYSEQTVKDSLRECFENARGRIILATFASNISRIQQIINIAEEKGRLVFFAGRSIEKIANIATEIGYLQMKKGMLIDGRQMDYLNPEQVLIITTGSQGEPMSGLVRMANDEHRVIAIQPEDTIIFSSSPIPGNEKAITDIIDKLYSRGCKVIYSANHAVHVSGHACQEEEKLMIALTRPRYFMPVHGEQRHLRMHAGIALQQGVPEENIVLPKIGTVIEIGQDGIGAAETIQAGAVFVDGSGVGDVGNVVLRDRRTLSEEGLFTVAVVVEQETGRLIGGPEIISRGFVYVRESEEMIEEAKTKVIEIVEAVCSRNNYADWGALKNEIRSELRKFLYQKTKRSPMILPIVMEVDQRVQEEENAEL
ncbi:MAG: ribonuclease J [Clostridia bacterium]|nr:ribonuclease J [Clostridia bacterium]